MNKKEPLEIMGSSKITNTEPNILGFPGLFVRGRNSKELPTDTRSATQIRLEGTTEIFEQVSISRTSHGFPTVTDLSVLFFLFDLFEEQGYPESIEVSLRSIADFLGFSWGGKNRDLVIASLDRLGSASFLWLTRFQTTTDKTASRERFTLLSYFHTEKSQPALAGVPSPKSFIEKTFVKLATQITNNLKGGYCIPIDLKTFAELKLDLSKQLYSWACSRLRLESDMTEKSFRISSGKLFEELSIEGERYKKLSRRREILSPAVDEINRKTVPQGFIEARLSEVENEIELELKILRPPKQIPSNSISAVELVELFLRIFDRQGRGPSKFEVSSAEDFLASYPLSIETAETYLTTILEETRNHGYSPDWFSGIKRNLLQMVQGGKLISATTKKRSPKKSKKPAPSLPTIKEPEGLVQLSEAEIEDLLMAAGERIFSDLEESAKQQLTEQVKTELLNSEKKKIFERWSEDVLEEHVRQMIYRRLVEENPVIFNEILRSPKAVT